MEQGGIAVKRLILTVSLAALAGCQTSTASYEAASGPGQIGYFSVPVEDNRVAVTYTGRKGMTQAEVAELAFLRAAELTLASGQQWFAVLHSDSRETQVGDINRLEGRSGAILTSESSTAGSGGDRRGAGPGVEDAPVPGGPTTGGFGGGDVPYQVLERWRPPSVKQTTLIVQMGSGNQASFEGLQSTPEIYSAQEVAAQIRAKM
jgi:hypothetical protein